LARAGAKPQALDDELAAVNHEISREEAQQPQSKTGRRIVFTGIGAAITIVLFVLRYLFPWWPLHPLGMAFGHVAIFQWVHFNIFIAWLAKTIIMRVGGIKLFNAAKPFFLGLIFGQFLIIGLGLLLDLLFFNQLGGGHAFYG
jgi:hypothetical protein